MPICTYSMYFMAVPDRAHQVQVLLWTKLCWKNVKNKKINKQIENNKDHETSIAVVEDKIACGNQYHMSGPHGARRA